MPLIQYGQVESGVVILERFTEDDNLRITETGDTRITNDVVTNVITSYLNAIPSLLTYNKEAFYNVNGVWKFLTPYVKHNNTWKEPNAIYVKQSGVWRRGY